jgi:site-specific recombinase XerD
LSKRRPVKRLLDDPVTGKGKAQVVQKPGQLEHILWAASRGETGRRNAVVIWMLFGSDLRINEVAQLQVKDVYYKNGELKKSFVIPGPYAKTGKPRSAYILAKHHRVALDAWYEQRIVESAMLSEDGTFGGLRGDSPLIVS